jgi:hypothetical protein
MLSGVIIGKFPLVTIDVPAGREVAELFFPLRHHP